MQLVIALFTQKTGLTFAANIGILKGMKTMKVTDLQLGFLLRVLIHIGVGSIPAIVFAGSPQITTGDGEMTVEEVAPWANNDKYQDCGQSCIYTKGNENLSMQVTYTLMKIRGLHQALVEDSIDGQQKVFASLKGFCRNSEVDAGQDGAKACAQRFVAWQVKYITSIKNAIINNDTSIYNLNNKSVGGVAYKDAPKGKLPQSSWVPKKEVLLEKGKKAKPNWATNQEYLTNAPPKPVCSDFIVFTPKARDPNDPSAGTLNVVDKSPEGEAKQKALCEAAIKTWEQKTKDAKWAEGSRIDEYNTNYSSPDKLAKIDEDALIQSRRILISTLEKGLKDLNMLKSDPKDSGAKSSGGLNKTGKIDRAMDAAGTVDFTKTAQTKPTAVTNQDSAVYSFKNTENDQYDVMPEMKTPDNEVNAKVVWDPTDLERMTYGTGTNENPGMIGVAEGLGGKGAEEAAVNSLINMAAQKELDAAKKPNSAQGPVMGRDASNSAGKKPEEPPKKEQKDRNVIGQSRE